MGLLDRISARTAAPADVVRAADPVTLEEFGYLLGQGRGDSLRTKAGTVIGPKRALGIAAWYSGVRYLSETVAALPVRTFRDVNGERSRRNDPAWVKRPDIELPWFALVEFAMMSLLHKGNSYSFKIRNVMDQVVGLRELHPDRVTVGVAPDGRKRFLVDNHEHVYTTREILHIPGLAYDGRVGLNPISISADVLGGVAASDDYSGRFFGQGTHMGGVISVKEPMTMQQAKDLRTEWETFHAGLTNAHRTGVLSMGSTYSPLALNAKDTQLIESRQYGVSEISRLLRLPPHKLYDLTRSTNNNIEHQSIEAITDGIQPWVERIEAFVNYDPDLLPAGNFIEFALEGRLRGDTQTRYAAYSSAVGAPWMVPNEARRLENLPPVDGGDELLSPLNMGQSATQANGGAL